MKPLVIYHADCTDGFGAAFAAWLKLGDEAEYLPCQYGEAVECSLAKEFNHFRLVTKKDVVEVKGREVYIIDFSFPRQITDKLFEGAKRVVWLDHHKSALEMWCGKYEKGTWFLDEPNGHYISLDDNKSGALLAWEYFHPCTEVPMLIRHIDDRDRWQFKLEGSKELHAALASYKPWSFEQWRYTFLEGAHGRYQEMLAQGAAILRAQDAHVKSMLKQARKCELFQLKAGPYEFEDVFRERGLAVNTPIHMSEVGHELANQSSTYGLVWYMGANNRVNCSLRSNGEYDVSTIARVFGGGGHRNAAGFETDINTLMKWLA